MANSPTAKVRNLAWKIRKAEQLDYVQDCSNGKSIPQTVRSILSSADFANQLFAAYTALHEPNQYVLEFPPCFRWFIVRKDQKLILFDTAEFAKYIQKSKETKSLQTQAPDIKLLPTVKDKTHEVNRFYNQCAKISPDIILLLEAIILSGVWVTIPYLAFFISFILLLEHRNLSKNKDIDQSTASAVMYLIQFLLFSITVFSICQKKIIKVLVNTSLLHRELGTNIASIAIIFVCTLHFIYMVSLVNKLEEYQNEQIKVLIKSVFFK